MKKEELNELRKNNLISSEKDEKSYERLYDALSKQDKTLNLSSGFQHKLNNVIVKRRREERFEKVVIYSVVGFLFIAALIVMAITGIFEEVNVLGGIQWYILIFIAMIWGFKKIEKKYLKST